MASDLFFQWDQAAQDRAEGAMLSTQSGQTLRDSLPLRLALVGALTDSATLDVAGEVGTYRVDLDAAVAAIEGRAACPDEYEAARLDVAYALLASASLVWQSAGSPAEPDGETGLAWPAAAAIAVAAVAAVAGLAWCANAALPIIDRAIVSRVTVQAMADADAQTLRLAKQVQELEERSGKEEAQTSPHYAALLASLAALQTRQADLAADMPAPADPPSAWTGAVWPIALAAAAGIALWRFT